MDKLSNYDENYDEGYTSSPSKTLAFSTVGGDSLAYCQTWTSSESETVNESSYASESSPSPRRKKPDVLSKLGMKLCKHSMDDKLGGSELLDSGSLHFSCVTFCYVLGHFEQVQYNF